MTTLFTTSPDNTKIAYDCNGSGPAIVLVHGGGSDRQVWYECGYVERLSKEYTVITLDLRGHGESDLPTDRSDYSTEKMGQDILSVTDSCGVDRFVIWGMSFGGKVSRYLAASSERIEKFILMGIPMGPGATDAMRKDIEGFCEYWPPILQAQRDGTLDMNAIPEDEREFMQDFNIPVMMAWGGAMLDWPAIAPGDFLCPTLWLIGSEDQPAMDSFRQHEHTLKGTQVRHHIFEGFDHHQVLTEIDQVIEIMLEFTNS